MHCTGRYGSYVRRLWKEHGIRLDITDEDRAALQAGTVDMYTFSYYMSSLVTTHEVTDMAGGNFTAGARNQYLEYSEWGWATDPDGLQYLLELLYDRYGLPIMVVENDVGAIDVLEADGSVHDPYRIDYLRQHVRAMDAAIANGVDLIGYTTWACHWEGFPMARRRALPRPREAVAHVQRDERRPDTLWHHDRTRRRSPQAPWISTASATTPPTAWAPTPT